MHCKKPFLFLKKNIEGRVKGKETKVFLKYSCKTRALSEKRKCLQKSAKEHCIGVSGSAAVEHAAAERAGGQSETTRSRSAGGASGTVAGPTGPNAVMLVNGGGHRERPSMILHLFFPYLNILFFNLCA